MATEHTRSAFKIVLAHGWTVIQWPRLFKGLLLISAVLSVIGWVMALLTQAVSGLGSSYRYYPAAAMATGLVYIIILAVWMAGVSSTLFGKGP